jgi:hypothetical protein
MVFLGRLKFIISTMKDILITIFLPKSIVVLLLNHLNDNSDKFIFIALWLFDYLRVCNYDLPIIESCEDNKINSDVLFQ